MARRLDRTNRRCVERWIGVTVGIDTYQHTASRILRFDRVQRTAHWATALLFGILMLTALPLYFPPLSGIVGRRALVVDIHVWAGILLPVPLLISMLGPWGARMRRDLGRVNRWTRDEIAWLWALGRRAPRVVDKFNPGQKLNSIFVGGVIVVMLITGIVLRWFQFFPVSWRTGATFVHDVFAFVIFIVVIGHITFAVAHPEALRSMVKGWVTRSWAARHAPGWLLEETGESDQDQLS
jgi:formate dehydrogenase subunit gamma